MPEGAGRGSQRKPSNQAAKRPSSVSSLSSIVGRMTSSASRGSCTSVNTVCSDSDRTASLSSSASSASLQDGHSSSSSSSLPYGAVPAYPSSPKRNGSDISLDLTPLSQLPPRGHPATPPAPPKLSHLERVALEIVETEQAYVRDLKSIVEDYLGCIIDCGDLPLKPDEVSTLFCNIEDIYEFNSELLEDLERSPHVAAIAECFVERSEAFDIYTLYCMNYPNSVAVLRDCMKNESLVHFFQERQTTLCHSLPLETYLLKPVQRILKYHLLLQELAKHFDKSDPGYEVVEDAIIAMTAVAWYINDMKRKQEHAVRLQEIESLLTNWTGPDLSGFGELVLEGSFRVQRVKKERAFFLFDKMLLIAKKRLEHFIYSTHIFCCNLLLVETMKDPLCFKVSDQTIPKQQHVVQTKNQEEKRLWLHYLKRLIVENHPASLPQKARQVLGDSCRSPQFDQEHVNSPRCDDYHRGRRQSEPPELIYTPEKAKKTLPLLLEGNLSYRRGRRQSAPTKDFETTFHCESVSLKASSEGELYPGADSLASSGSTSTLASSVIEVGAEAKRPDLCMGLEDDDDLSHLSPPPTLSITEEIMQFINESRVREGLAELRHDVDPPADESLEDQTTERHPYTVAQQGNDQLLPSPNKDTYDSQDPHPHSPEDKTVQKNVEGNRAKMEDHTQEHSQASPESLIGDCEGGESTPLPANVMEEVPEEECTLAKEPEAPGERTKSEAKDEQTNEMQALLFHVNLPENQKDPCIDFAYENKPPGSSLLLLTGPERTVQNPVVSKKETQFKKSDMQIIKKIRSYYEAAEAEAGQAGDGDSSLAPRRNSFSLIIPAGLVKDSVSRFAVFGHQDSLCDSESGRSDGGAEAEPERPSPLTSMPDQGGEGALGPLCSSAAGDGGSKTLEEENRQAPDQGELVVEFTSEQGSELRHCTELIKVWKEKEMGTVAISSERENKTNLAKDISKKTLCSDEAAKVITKEVQAVSDHKTSSSYLDLEPKQAQKDSIVPSPTGYQAGWGRTRDSSPTGNLEGLPSQIKVGRWSRHCKMVSSSRTLYEGVAVGNVEAIGLFEASPGYPSLVENSERILSKVQMLARMYSAKASSMKVPLHHKRACVGRAPWAPTPGRMVPAQTEQLPQHPEEMSTVKRAHSHTAGHQEFISVTSEPQVVGHILVSEQLSPSYHQQENGCVLAGPRGGVSNLGSMSTASPRSSSPTTTQKNNEVGCEEGVTTAVQEKPMENQFDEAPSDADMQRQNPSMDSPVQEGPVQGVGMFSGDNHPASVTLSNRTWMEQKGHHLYSIKEDPALGSAAASSEGGVFGVPDELLKIIQQLSRAEPETSQMVKPDKDSLNNQPVLHCGTGGAEGGDSPQMSPGNERQAGSSEEKSPDGTLNDMDVLSPNISAHISPRPPQQMSISAPFEGSDLLVMHRTQSCTTESTQTTHICGQGVEENQVVSRLQSSDCLPNFTSQRPPHLHLPTTMGRRSLPIKTSDTAVLPSQRPPPASLRSKEPGPDPLGYSSALSPIRHPSSEPSLEKLFPLTPSTGHAMDAKPPYALSPSLRHRSPSHVRGLPGSSSNPSALTRSMAASCISQSLAKMNARIQGHATTPLDSPAPSLRMRSPSPNQPSGPSGPPHSSSQARVSQPRDSSQPTNCPPPPLRSSPAMSPPPYHSQPPVSPAPPVSLHGTTSPPRPRPVALDLSRHMGLNGNNNNNNGDDGGWAATHRKPPLASASSAPRSHDEPLWSGSTHTHNRVARPFSASEPSSRVQSPSPSPFSRICSPPPVLNQPSPLTDQPKPRSTRANGPRPFNHLGLSLEFPKASSACSSGITSPRITSPPPIGVPVSVWGVPAPQPRNAKVTSPSPSVASPTWRDGFSPDPSIQRSFNSTPPPPSRFSPCSLTISQSLRSTKGGSLPFFNLVERPPSPVRNGMRSWGESGGHSSIGVEQETGMMSPRGGTFSYNGSPSCLSPGALSPVRLAPGESTHGGQHFTSIAWPDVQELLTKYDSTEVADQSAPASPSWPKDELWGDPDLREDSCRTHLICAYVPRASPVTGMSVPIQYTHRSKPEDASSTQPAKGTIKTSYATTVNLQIAGSGRITSFSNAQVSLTQTLAPVGDSQGIRRVSINTCNLPQNSKRL
ncbi:uncharacterized protein plekhg2 isoform X1 [Esox lucius]|uniref:Pleckstrin homology domain containing, family G (with RhoGef domain) member 2 n=2 Tax=Esox lucius TaxID=8010 RepID=A0AAY5KHU4_ESOLU|nr:uncharacterized protein plekhg2 isoform X1 [Esox lucius]